MLAMRLKLRMVLVQGEEFYIEKLILSKFAKDGFLSQFSGIAGLEVTMQGNHRENEIGYLLSLSAAPSLL